MKKRYPRGSRWIAPGAEILCAPSPSAPIAEEFSHDALANFLTDSGLACVPAGMSSGTSATVYGFNLLDVRKVSKVYRTLPALEATTKRKVLLSSSDVAHFELAISRENRTIVPLRTAMLTPEFAPIVSPTLSAFGTDTSGKTLAANISDLPHLLIAGATGSGKSVLLHSIICSMLFKCTPAGVQFVMIDPKRIELTIYDGLAHLGMPVVTDVSDALAALNGVCVLMDERYKQIEKANKANALPPIFSRVIVVIDELADLMLTSKKQAEPAIVRLAQLGRAAGIHLIVATQRPTVNVVTGLIKANMPARIALTMASWRDAGVMEISGADKLSGRGDGLYQPPNHTMKPIRFQAAYTSTEDVRSIVQYWRHNALYTKKGKPINKY